ncbi:5369_t:CDS:2 [Entrophospora sp. SA101]|nr:14332_t:CDS:2 [Entrophospora sp. SA101]CAJ0753773.1 5369_t:CDS:2 [Entrophospora sp. SA101]CAJ0870330.1 7180_t:CDS:2 [Entrophospora sp. SA101]
MDEEDLRCTDLQMYIEKRGETYIGYRDDEITIKSKKGFIKRNLVKRHIKVLQLAGYISEDTAFHHKPMEQFGNRNDGGKSATSALYINTKLSSFARLIHNPNDVILLNFLNENGQQNSMLTLSQWFS